MAAALAPAMRIYIRPQRSDKAFLFVGENGKEVAVGTRSSLNRLLEDQSSFRPLLERFRDHGSSGLKLSWTRAGTALEDLKSVANYFLAGMMNGDYLSLADICQMWNAGNLKARASGTTPWVQIVLPEPDAVLQSVPFELLPMLSPPAAAGIVNHIALGEALDSFLGFSAILSRVTRESVQVPDLASDEGRLAVKLFQNTELASAEQEIRFFRSRQAKFDLDGPWPVDPIDGPEAIRFVASHLLDPAVTLAGRTRKPPDQVQHFVCHCETFGAAADYTLTLGSSEELQHKITLSNLIDYQIAAARAQALGRGAMPLVFLNACGSSSIDPGQIGSFVQFFLSNGNRGIIGTQTLIPDDVAAKFAELFYLGLTAPDKSVGEAVLEARQKLAKQYLNPLGILYMHFGRSELKVAEPSLSRVAA